jgi:hypothetical protein
MPDSNKKDHRKDILERDTDTQDESGKQVKIDKMMAPKKISDETKADLDKVYEQIRSVKSKIKEAHTEIEYLKKLRK